MSASRPEPNPLPTDSPTIRWERIELDGTDAAHRIAALLQPVSRRHPDWALDHDPSWLLAPLSGDVQRSFAVVGWLGSTLIDYAAVTRAPSSLPFTIGETTLWRYPIERLQISSGDLVDVTQSNPSARLISTALLGFLAKSLRHRQLIFLQGVRVGSPLHAALQPGIGGGDRFHVIPYGDPYRRRLIDLTDSFDAYLGKLGKATRSALRKTRRRLESHLGGPVQLEVHTDLDSVARFLEQAEAVSKRTYQWHLLERGIKDREHFEAVLRNAARNGLMRCYTLICHQEPAAFMVGFVHHGRYYSTDIGYEPKWAKWSVGNVMHCEVMEDLIQNCNLARRFDFMGDTVSHQRLSCGLYLEQANYYLLPKTLEGTMLAFALRFVDGSSVLLGRVLDRLGLKARIRRWIRRRASDRGGVSSDASDGDSTR